jgi:hypothetical protein
MKPRNAATRPVVFETRSNKEIDLGQSEGNLGGSPLPETTLILAIIETDQKITTTVYKVVRKGRALQRPPTAGTPRSI